MDVYFQLLQVKQLIQLRLDLPLFYNPLDPVQQSDHLFLPVDYRLHANLKWDQKLEMLGGLSQLQLLHHR